MISRLQFISQETGAYTHLQSIEVACRSGVDWVQLRVKNQPVAYVQELAEEARRICTQHGARLIINDYAQVAAAVGADGLHLGKEDMPIAQARQIVGNIIIGQTANTFEDICQHAQNGADYVGVGPFAFTTTKEKLSPILGLEGYRKISQSCQQQGIRVPLIAIGGIGLDDIPALMETGVWGIAVSSLLVRAQDPKATLEAILKALEQKSATAC